MAFRLTSIKKSSGAFTLVELMVSGALGLLLITGLVSVYSFSTTSFASITSYAEMSQKTRYASDLISRDVRSSSAVDVSTTSNKLVLNYSAGTNITYLYNSTAGTLVRSTASESRALLTNLNFFVFSLYQRPTNRDAAFELFPPGNAASAKLIGFEWKCSKRIVGTQVDSQELETGIVELRNH